MLLRPVPDECQICKVAQGSNAVSNELKRVEARCIERPAIFTKNTPPSAGIRFPTTPRCATLQFSAVHRSAREFRVGLGADLRSSPDLEARARAGRKTNCGKTIRVTERRRRETSRRVGDVGEGAGKSRRKKAVWK